MLIFGSHIILKPNCFFRMSSFLKKFLDDFFLDLSCHLIFVQIFCKIVSAQTIGNEIYHMFKWVPLEKICFDENLEIGKNEILKNLPCLQKCILKTKCLLNNRNIYIHKLILEERNIWCRPGEEYRLGGRIQPVPSQWFSSPCVCGRSKYCGVLDLCGWLPCCGKNPGSSQINLWWWNYLENLVHIVSNISIL